MPGIMCEDATAEDLRQYVKQTLLRGFPVNLVLRLDTPSMLPRRSDREFSLTHGHTGNMLADALVLRK